MTDQTERPNDAGLISDTGDAGGTDAITTLRGAWSGEGSSRDEFDAACGNTKICRNMREVNFEAANFQTGSETGADIGSAWRAKLRREGKLAPDSQSLGDLITSLVDARS